MQITPFSQRDPRWRDDLLGYSTEYTIGTAGCALTCAAMIAAVAEPCIDPGALNELLKVADGFMGALIKWDKVAEVVPGVMHEGGAGWRTIGADMEVVADALADGPVILQVDSRPRTVPLDSHFVVAPAMAPPVIFEDGSDLAIIDPWDGARTRLLQRYAMEHWDLARAIYGMRLLRVPDVPEPEPLLVLPFMVGALELGRMEVWADASWRWTRGE